jgi:hypothetical protein
MKRAWVFQERFLSPQIVYFAYNELYWEDGTTMKCECSGEFIGKDSLNNYQRAYTRSFTPYHLSDADTRNRYWHNIVQEYTRMALTYDGDIFPALQGVADIVQQYCGCAYYAGLWEDSLSRDLLWYSPTPGVRPRKFRAPTWSWASVKGRAAFEYEDIRSLAEVHSPYTTPVDDNSLGQLSGGSLKIRTQGRRAILDTYYHGQNRRPVIWIETDSGSGYDTSWFPDVAEELKRVAVIFLRMGDEYRYEYRDVYR